MIADWRADCEKSNHDGVAGVNYYLHLPDTITHYNQDLTYWQAKFISILTRHRKEIPHIYCLFPGTSLQQMSTETHVNDCMQRHEMCFFVRTI